MTMHADTTVTSERQHQRLLERLQRCRAHQRHETREQAEEKVSGHRPCSNCARKRVVFRAFPCQVCNGWHVGHKYISPYR